VVVVYPLEAEIFIVIRIILENVLTAIEPITLLTDVGNCMANLLGLLELFICLILLDHLLHDSNTLGTFADESVTIEI